VDLTPYAPRTNVSEAVASSRGAPLPPWHRWDARAEKLHRIESARSTLLDPIARKFHDQPCEPVFGGAMCARRTADGGMSIVMG
jgi:hypothetical protein